MLTECPMCVKGVLNSGDTHMMNNKSRLVLTGT